MYLFFWTMFRSSLLLGPLSFNMQSITSATFLITNYTKSLTSAKAIACFELKQQPAASLNITVIRFYKKINMSIFLGP